MTLFEGKVKLAACMKFIGFGLALEKVVHP